MIDDHDLFGKSSVDEFPELTKLILSFDAVRDNPPPPEPPKIIYIETQPAPFVPKVNMANVRVPPSRKPARGYLYIVRTTESNIYKIGVSVNPEQRLKEIQTCNHEVVERIMVLQTPDQFRIEQELHIRFWLQRKRGEWYRLTTADINYIQQRYVLEEAA